MRHVYNVKMEKDENDGTDIMRVGFGDPAQNDEIVRYAKKMLDDMKRDGEIKGGKIVKIDGPASLPVGIAIGHEVAHLYEVVAVFDPKLGKYVVAVSHGNEYEVGQLIK